MKTIRTSKAKYTINANTTENLRDLLAARLGYATFVATLGTNGNGGALSEISDIIAADEDDQHLDSYELATIESGELEQHARDAGGKIEDGDDWVAFECVHADASGYLTGSTSRVYVNLAI
jgi:hypothetical protein